MPDKKFTSFLNKKVYSAQITIGGAICQIVNNGNQAKPFQNQAHIQPMMQTVKMEEAFI